MWQQILQQQAPRDWVDWLGAIGPLVGTLIALVIAVFVDQLRAARRKLKVSIHHDDRDDCHKTRWKFGTRSRKRAAGHSDDAAALVGVPTSTAMTETRTEVGVQLAGPAFSTGTADPRYGPQLETVYLEPKEAGTQTKWHLVDVYYLRLRVRNEGKRIAEKVEVYATELRRKQADETYKRVESFQSMNLLWSYYRTVFLSALSP